MPKTQKLIERLIEKENLTKKHAEALIRAGLVIVNEHRVDKPGALVPLNATIRLKKKSRYVSRAGDKLAGAWKLLQFPIQDAIACDIGVSTGGFSDFLLQHGAKTVFAVDVSYGLTALKIRQDPRVILLERCNARHLTKEMLENAVQKQQKNVALVEDISLLVMDVSFISAVTILETLAQFLPRSCHIIIMMKPQFEAKSHEVEPGGVVNNEKTRHHVHERFKAAVINLGYRIKGECDAPIKGQKKGNQERFYWFYHKNK